MPYPVRAASSGYLTGSNHSYGGSFGGGSLRKEPLRQQTEVLTQSCPESTYERPTVSYHKQSYSYRGATQEVYDTIRRKKQKEKEEGSQRRLDKESVKEQQKHLGKDLPISLAIKETMTTMVTNHCSAHRMPPTVEKIGLTDTPEKHDTTTDDILKEHRRKMELIEEVCGSLEPSLLRMEVPEALMPGALAKLEELKKILQDVAEVIEKSFEQATRDIPVWPNVDRRQLAQNDFLMKRACLNDVTKKLKKKEQKLLSKVVKMSEDGWIAKTKDFFIPAAPKVGRLREEIGNLKKEAENYRTTGLEKLKYRLLGDELWEEPSQKDSVSTEANPLNRIRDEVQKYFQKDLEAMQEAAAGGGWYTGQPSSGGATSTTTTTPAVPNVNSPAEATETAESGRDLTESSQGERAPQQETSGRSNNATSSSDTPASSRTSSSNGPTQASTSSRRVADYEPSGQTEPKRQRRADTDAEPASAASTKVKPTNVLAEERPFAQAVMDENLSTCCSNCMATKVSHIESVKSAEVNFHDCAKCHQIYYCSKKCEKEDSKFHKAECEFLTKSEFCPSQDVRLVSRVITRVREGDLPVAFNGRTFDDLMSHSDVVVQGKFEKAYKRFRDDITKFMGAENLPPEKELISFYGKFMTNGYTTAAGSIDVGVALYTGYGSEFSISLSFSMSIHDHSCRPNCIRMFDGNKILLKSLDSTAVYNKDLTVAYNDILRPKEFRTISHLFDCQCARCMDKENMLLERAGRCEACPDGYVLPVDNGPLHCGQCGEGSSLTTQEINTANKKLEYLQEYDTIDEFFKEHPVGEDRAIELWDEFDEAEKILSPSNLHLNRLAGVVKSSCAKHFGVTADLGYPLMERCLLVNKESAEKYSPYSRRHRRAVLEVADLAKFGYEEIDKLPAQRAKAAAAFKEAHSVIRECYGPRHVLTKKLEEEMIRLRD